MTTTRKGYQGHLNIGAAWVLEQAKARPDRTYVSIDGRDLYGDEQIAVIAEDIANGRKWFCNCPTPDEDGGCPTHPL